MSLRTGNPIAIVLHESRAHKMLLGFSGTQDGTFRLAIPPLKTREIGGRPLERVPSGAPTRSRAMLPGNFYG